MSSPPLSSRSSDLFPNIQSKDIQGVYQLMKKEGKGILDQPSPVSYPIALISLFLGVPLWLGVLLPLTISYHILATIWKAISFGEKGSTPVSEATEELQSFPETPKPLKDRTFDIIILGATGFTGQLALEYMFKTYGVKKSVRWAIAGRSSSKLQAVKSKVANKCNDQTVMDIEEVIVDTSVRSTIHNLVKDTRAIITFAGPYGKYGSSVVEFCAHYGTHYSDITGEAPWNKDMKILWDSVARRTGAKIISFCGCDCIPWDMTVHHLAQLAKEELKDEITDVEIYSHGDGGISGGTIDTILHYVSGMYKPMTNSNVDPYLLKRDGTQSDIQTKNVSPILPTRCSQPRLGSPRTGTAPWLFTMLNVDHLRCSNTLRGIGQGMSSKMNYRESMLVHDLKTAVVTSLGLAISLTALSNPIVGNFARWVGILPKPGEGPSEATMEAGYLMLSGFATCRNGGKIETAMYFPHDIGYRETARMATESALCLALDGDKLPSGDDGGFFTVSTGMGDALLERLCRTGTSLAGCVTHKS